MNRFLEWMSAFPYLALMSTKVIDFQQLAITFTCIPLSSILGPIVTGMQMLFTIVCVVFFK